MKIKKFLENINTWIFDLDNTIYPSSKKIFHQIDKRMTRFISSKLNVDTKKAFSIQKEYYFKYGTTLFGLMKNHKIKPNIFLEYVHDIDLSTLKPEPKLKNLIKSLNGKKLIHTNSSKLHAENVLQSMDMLDIFEDIFDIEASKYIPKPNKQSYIDLLKKFSCVSQESAMFEDSIANLTTASEMGMVTILIGKNEMNQNMKKPIRFSYNVKSLLDWFRIIEKK